MGGRMSDEFSRKVLIDYAMTLGDEDAVRLLQKREQGFETAFIDFCRALARERAPESVLVIMVEQPLFWFFRRVLSRLATNDVPYYPHRRVHMLGLRQPIASWRDADMIDASTYVAESFQDLHSFEVKSLGGVTVKFIQDHT